MPVLSQATDEISIDFDNSAQLIDVLHESGSDLVAHEPSGFQRTETHIAPNLASAYSLFASHHQMNDATPFAERLIGVFENRASNDREPIAVWGTFFALPMPLTSFEAIDLGIAATWATDAVGPAPGV
jgi:hypothetical protein